MKTIDILCVDKVCEQCIVILLHFHIAEYFFSKSNACLAYVLGVFKLNFEKDRQ